MISVACIDLSDGRITVTGYCEIIKSRVTWWCCSFIFGWRWKGKWNRKADRQKKTTTLLATFESTERVGEIHERESRFFSFFLFSRRDHGPMHHRLKFTTRRRVNSEIFPFLLSSSFFPFLKIIILIIIIIFFFFFCGRLLLFRGHRFGTHLHIAKWCFATRNKMV